ncbi:MAG TPA: type 1 glutamine amidotransferase domain-containing protein [Polyangia bacterium]|jgi:putative intracellular protease/amidase|nr:type 1 glutamine amidotransferase domain-containing protein [Polyangia bacterium]
MTDSKRVLIILTSHGTLGTSGKPTGFWFEELAAPYYQLLDAGVEVQLASPRGGRPPVDPASQASPPEIVKRFLADDRAMDKLANTLPLAAADGPYDAYFVAGGHGVMWDLAGDATLSRLLERAATVGKVVAAVCHGPAALVGLKRPDGEPLVRGLRVAAFSNEEEKAAHLDAVVPFALQSRLEELGARYQRGPMWTAFAVRDGNLVTGQNPQSSVAVAREVLAALAL